MAGALRAQVEGPDVLLDRRVVAGSQRMSSPASSLNRVAARSQRM
nr:hypothetical protein [Nocardiopsis exhalans]